MRLRCGVATAALLGASVLATVPARAQYVEWKASAMVTGSYNQTVSEAPNTMASAVPSAHGPSLSIGPSLIALIDTPRTDNTLTYAFSLNHQFFIGGVPNGARETTYSNRFMYTGHYELTEITSMLFGANITQSPLNAFVPSLDAADTPIQQTPTGTADMVQLGADEGLTTQVVENTSFTQSTSVLYGNPIDPFVTRAKTLSIQNSLSLSRSLSRDTLSVTLSNQTNYFTAGQLGADKPVVLGHTQMVDTLSVSWIHPFSESLSMTLAPGISHVIGFGPAMATKNAIQPTGTASLNYTFNLATAGLLYAHQATPNLTLGTLSYVDQVSLRFNAPLGGQKLGLSGSGTAGYTHTTPIATDETTTLNLIQPTNVVLADLALTYKPPAVPTLSFVLRGQLQKQIESDPTNSFTRYAAALSVIYSYPNANAAATTPKPAPVFTSQPIVPTDIVSSDRPFTLPADDTPPPQQQPQSE